jgi:hypothetical protein
MESTGRDVAPKRSLVCWLHFTVVFFESNVCLYHSIHVCMFYIPNYIASRICLFTNTKAIEEMTDQKLP